MVHFVSIPNRDWEKLQQEDVVAYFSPDSGMVSIPNRDWEKLQLSGPPIEARTQSFNP